MSEPNPGAPGAQAEPKSITIRTPRGESFQMPTWQARGMIEGLLRDDRAVYQRHMMNLLTGEPASKPGRRATGEGS